MLLDGCQRLLAMDLHHCVTVLIQKHFTDRADKVKISQDYDRTKIRKTEKLAKCWGQSLRMVLA